jgi:hypothetical protein
MESMLLFGQSVASERFEPALRSAFMISMAVGFGVLLPLILLGMKKAQLAHIERMKAMELGFVPSPSRGPLAFYCSAVGLGVPIITFVITWLATQTGNSPHDIWVAPSVVSGLAILGVTIVAAIGFGRPEASAHQGTSTAAKPAQDPEAYDFAGRLNRH